MLKPSIGELLRDLRGKESLRDASKRIGISHTYLDTIEKGYDKRSGNPVNPTPETLKLISKAYNYPYKKLMELAGYIDDEFDDIPDDIDDLETFIRSKKTVTIGERVLTEEEKEKAIEVLRIMFNEKKESTR